MVSDRTRAIREAQAAGGTVDMGKLAAGAVVVIAAIHQTKPKPGDSGETPCPVCGVGKVVWSYGGPRAIRAACTTADCLTFMS